jgi:hypothetical protein
MAVHRLYFSDLDRSELPAFDPSSASINRKIVVFLNRACVFKVSKRACRFSNFLRDNATVSDGCCWFDGIDEWPE